MPNQGVYNYSLRFTVNSGDAIKVESLAIVTDVMAHPLSLPRLNLGSNVFKYLLRIIYMEYVYVEFVCKYLCVFYIYIVRSRYTDDSSTRDILIEHRCLLHPLCHSHHREKPLFLDELFSSYRSGLSLCGALLRRTQVPGVLAPTAAAPNCPDVSAGQVDSSSRQRYV